MFGCECRLRDYCAEKSSGNIQASRQSASVQCGDSGHARLAGFLSRANSGAASWRAHMLHVHAVSVPSLSLVGWQGFSLFSRMMFRISSISQHTCRGVASPPVCPCKRALASWRSFGAWLFLPGFLMLRVRLPTKCTCCRRVEWPSSAIQWQVSARVARAPWPL